MGREESAALLKPILPHLPPSSHQAPPVRPVSARCARCCSCRPWAWKWRSATWRQVSGYGGRGGGAVRSVLQTMGLEVAQRYLETGEWRRRGGGGGQLGREEKVWRAP